MSADTSNVTGYVVTSASGATIPAGYALETAQRGAVPHTSALSTDQRAVTSALGYTLIADPASMVHTATYGHARWPGAASPMACVYVLLQTSYPPYEDILIDYDFRDIRFPTCLSYGSSGGPGFKTSIFSVDSGLVTAQQEWERLRSRYEVVFEHANSADVHELEDFFYGVRGRGIGFRFKDWQDYQINNQIIAVGDGETSHFQLFKRYKSGTNFFDRMIKKPLPNTARNIAMDGTELVLNRDIYINHATGAVTFETAPPAGAIVTIGYIEFDVPVRFDTDQLIVEAFEFDQYRITDLPLIEVLT